MARVTKGAKIPISRPEMTQITTPRREVAWAPVFNAP
jgi:hypothetical protein